jgi:hypothetical protein
MATQTDFTNLEQLRLLDHGDGIERYHWPKVSLAISEYQGAFDRSMQHHLIGLFY